MTAYERRIRDWSSDVCSSDLTTVTFSFHHGKDGTATTGLEVKLPEGASVVEVPEEPGWTSSVDEAEGVVSWTGGSVPDGQRSEGRRGGKECVRTCRSRPSRSH